MGAITPLGNSRAAFWEALQAGRSGVGPITAFEPGKLTTKIAAEVKGFDPDALFGRRDARRMDRYAQFALAAAREAMADANLPEDPDVREQVGAIVGTGIGGIITVENTTFEVGPGQKWDRISPFFVPMLMANAASAQVSMTYGLKGPIFAVSSACASANDAFATAYDKIVLGDAIAVVTGGSEATVIPTAMGGFCSMKAMSTRNDDYAHASRPFDKERDGFVLGEGAGILVLEERKFALQRGATIYAELLGYGQSADAYHIAQPDPESRGVILAMRRALERTGVAPESVGYINAHGTSTPLGDLAESQAIERVFGAHAHAGLAVSSTKSMHGHLLGAAGAIEGIACVLALQDGIIPPTTNYEVPDPGCTLDYVPNVARKAPELRIAMSNGFGFGGHNTSVVFAKHEP
ncbi:3-oxoacyl-[acyl-carrier-protein] synthase 2 [Vulcanimicrobium alpinum]|uniref:3-oxoacyl-[acyl-carrier-protein] synthase 2 n=2 Tax=Vulcanimicrobium alpinum TaxID=3016050 RepID=A0AAN1Y081_UNVUL|nr:3-oxoacyl-[acyl-carrier-protein] synthase 2 [Vulcanimicrobium alpinum]